MPSKKKRERDPRATQRGIKIRKARMDLRLSQESVANRLGVTREAVSQWESGDVGEIERASRLGLCKLLGFEERELILDADGAPQEFEMPLTREAKSVAYRWDDLPESLRVHIKQQMTEAERLMRETPELARKLYPEIEDKKQKKT
jgi:transcriptional regulator with XRE-family HTH domain